MKTKIYLLNELTITPLILDIASGNKPCVFAVMPLMRINLFWISAVVEWGIKRGLIRSNHDIDHDLPWVEGVPGRGIYNDVFKIVEHAAHAKFGVSNIRAWDTGYDYPVRKAVSWWISELTKTYLLWEWLTSNKPADDFAIHGAPADLDWLIAAYRSDGHVIDQSQLSFVQRAINFLLALASVTFGLIWLLLRVRLTVQKTSYDIATDGRAIYDKALFQKLIGRGQSLIVYHRNKSLANDPSWEGWPSCLVGDGRIALHRLPGAMLEMASDAFSLWIKYSGVHPALFGKIVAQPVKRQIFRALFARIRVNFMWCRDDYSIDHIVRSQELRAVGGKSIGVNHGVPRQTYFAAWREVDFDFYLGYGSHIYENYYRSSWPPHLRHIAVGNSRLSLEDFEVPEGRRSRDFAVFQSLTAQNRQFATVVKSLALRYPTRKVYFKVKPGRAADEMRAFEEVLSDAPSNLVWTDTDPYALLRDVSYAVSCGSTLGVEALQFGVASFVVDLNPSEPDFIFRDFPEMIVSDAVEIEARVNAIENDDRPYRFEKMQNLIELKPKSFVDAMSDVMAANVS